MSLDQLGLLMLAVAALAGIARLLRLGENRLSTPAIARERAEELLAGFVAHGAVVSSDGRAAVVAGKGVVAVLRRRGTKLAARQVGSPLVLRLAVEGVSVDTGESVLGVVTLLGVVDDEVRAIEASV